jgi:hypothetical protein
MDRFDMVVVKRTPSPLFPFLWQSPLQWDVIGYCLSTWLHGRRTVKGYLEVSILVLEL